MFRVTDLSQWYYNPVWYALPRNNTLYVNMLHRWFWQKSIRWCHRNENVHKTSLGNQGLLPLLPDPHSTWPLTGGGSTGALVRPHGQRPSHWALTDSERGGIFHDCSPLNHSYSGSSSRSCLLWETYQDNRLRKQNSWEPMGTQTMIRWRFAVQVCDYNAS